MKNKDILDAIDELDLKYVTSAWENTEPREKRAFRIGGAPKRRTHRVIPIISCAAAAVAAVFLTVVIVPRVNPNYAPNKARDDLSVEGGVSSYVVQETEMITSDVSTGEPYLEYHLKSIQSPVDPTAEVTWAENDTNIKIADDGEDTIIMFGNLAYLAAPQNNYNSIELPRFFVNGVGNQSMRKLYDILPTYEPYSVGDKYGTLTVSKAETTVRVAADNPAASNSGTESSTRVEEMNVEFDGTATVNAMISYTGNDNVYFAIPMYNETAIPAVTPICDGDSEDYYSSVFHLNVNGSVFADNDVAIELTNADKFDSLTQRDTENYNGVKSATLQLTDVKAHYDRGGTNITAKVEMASAVSTLMPSLTDYFHGTNAQDVIINYSKAVNVSIEDTATGESVQVVSIEPISDSETDLKAVIEDMWLDSSPVSRPINTNSGVQVEDYRVILNTGEENYFRLVFDEDTGMYTVVKAVLANGTGVGR